jgi:RNA polymerase sigma-70 factor (ECF subfamily)
MQRSIQLTTPDVQAMETLGRQPNGRDHAVTPSTPTEEAEARLLTRVRLGDEDAFVRLVDQHDGALRRIARTYASEALADDIVQETWLAVLRSADRFEGRSSIRTWMVGIMRNIAITHARRERRQIPFSTFAAAVGPAEPAVPPDRFQGPAGRFPGGWVSFPERWDEQPERRFLSSEGVEVARRLIASLPPAQRDVVTLRDVDGWSSEEVSDALGITAGNQRVLLHRGRSKVRAQLEHAISESRPLNRSNGQVPVEPVAHPGLEGYYDRPADRVAIDAHVVGCLSCRASLMDISERLGRLTCVEFVELVTDFLEDAVDDGARAQIDEHLRLCDGCRNYLDEMRATLATIGAGRSRESVKPSAEVRAGLVAVFRLWHPGVSPRDP